MSVNLLRSRSLIFLLLACFLLAKTSFWIALSPAGTPAGPHQTNPPTSHPCACSGAPACNCGPGGCCDTAQPSKSASLLRLDKPGSNKNGPTKNSENPPELHTPKVCGHIGSGMGPVGEGACLVTAMESVSIEELPSERFPFLFVFALISRFEAPDSPPPRA